MDQKYLNKIKRATGNWANGAILGDMVDNLGKYISSQNSSVLDIASDKNPLFSGIMASVFKEAKFTHFRNNQGLKLRILKKYSKNRFPNLNIVYDPNELDPSYDLAIAFLTLH